MLLSLLRMQFCFKLIVKIKPGCMFDPNQKTVYGTESLEILIEISECWEMISLYFGCFDLILAK